MNECEERKSNCSANSHCKNNVGGYDCPCNEGYSKKGDACEGK